LDKNIKAGEMAAILRKLEERKGKKSAIRIRGRPVEPAKVERYAKKLHTSENPELSPDSPPAGLLM
jgi:hypothetical protein